VIVLCIVEALLPSPRFIVGLITGFFVTAVVAVVGFAFLFNGDGAFLIAGALGESHTEDELVAAKMAGNIWGAVPNVEVSKRDVDHIVLTPSGVLAVQSKWRFKGADQRYLAWAVNKAQAAARQAQLVLLSKGVDYRTDVRPVLVIWGGARRELPMAQVVDGVDVVRGDYLGEWLKQCARGRLAQDHAEALQSKIVPSPPATARPDRPATAPAPWAASTRGRMNCGLSPQVGRRERRFSISVLAARTSRKGADSCGVIRSGASAAGVLVGRRVQLAVGRVRRRWATRATRHLRGRHALGTGLRFGDDRLVPIPSCSRR